MKVITVIKNTGERIEIEYYILKKRENNDKLQICKPFDKKLVRFLPLSVPLSLFLVSSYSLFFLLLCVFILWLFFFSASLIKKFQELLATKTFGDTSKFWCFLVTSHTNVYIEPAGFIFNPLVLFSLFVYLCVHVSFYLFLASCSLLSVYV